MIDGGLRPEHVGKFEQHPAGFCVDLDVAEKLRLGVLGPQALD
jgi:hypothetical protein